MKHVRTLTRDPSPAEVNPEFLLFGRASRLVVFIVSLAYAVIFLKSDA